MKEMSALFSCTDVYGCIGAVTCFLICFGCPFCYLERNPWRLPLFSDGLKYLHAMLLQFWRDRVNCLICIRAADGTARVPGRVARCGGW